MRPRLLLALAVVVLLAGAAACSNGRIECDNAPCTDFINPDASAPTDGGGGG